MSAKSGAVLLTAATFTHSATRVDLLNVRIIERVVEGTQAPGRLLAQSRVGGEEHPDQLLALRIHEA